MLAAFNRAVPQTAQHTLESPMRACLGSHDKAESYWQGSRDKVFKSREEHFRQSPSTCGCGQRSLTEQLS